MSDGFGQPGAWGSSKAGGARVRPRGTQGGGRLLGTWEEGEGWSRPSRRAITSHTQHCTALHCTNPRAVSARERRHIIPSAPGLTPHSQKKASLPNLKSKTTIPFLYIEIACAAKKLSRLPAVSPPTRQSDMNPPAASASSSPTYSANPIMQLLPRYPLLTPKQSCTTTR